MTLAPAKFLPLTCSILWSLRASSPALSHNPALSSSPALSFKILSNSPALPFKALMARHPSYSIAQGHIPNCQMSSFCVSRLDTRSYRIWRGPGWSRSRDKTTS
ncbi:hypothetical protein GE09DRAFT_1136735 [Coniochaeta sp. 2T2.1]|nr:hypothetical protein GE09DRAFT_1136735 [Coniochaeta sp. 2T2.1]